MIHNVTENSGELLSLSSLEIAGTEQAELVFGDSNGDLRIMKYPV